MLLDGRLNHSYAFAPKPGKNPNQPQASSKEKGFPLGRPAQDSWVYYGVHISMNRGLTLNRKVFQISYIVPDLQAVG